MNLEIESNLSAPPTTRSRKAGEQEKSGRANDAPVFSWHAHQRRARLILLTLASGVMITTVLATGFGAMRIPTPQVASILAGKLGISLPMEYSPQQANVLLLLRAPRICMALLLGSGLAMCGAVLQGLFRNPLADPALTGISSGAALGAVGAIVLESRMGVHASIWWLPVAAFTGALAVTIFIHRFSQFEGKTNVTQILLAGIAVNAFCLAVIGFFTYMATDAQLRTISFWNLGSLASGDWRTLGVIAPLIVIPLYFLMRQARVLNALLLGEAEATHLGFHVESTKRVAIFLTAIIVGASVAFSGIISFVGLIAPHLVRLILGPDHRMLLPGSAMTGGLLLVFADTICRTVAAPAEIPIGVLTGLLGAPFFFYLLHREKSRT